MKTVDFSETIAATDLTGRSSRHLIEFTKVCEGHFFTIYFPGFVFFVLYLAKISKSFLYHIFSRFCMFCALLGQDIR